MNNSKEKPVVWRSRKGIKTPPFSREGRKVAGQLIRTLQRGEEIPLKHYFSPLPSIGPRCHELRIKDSKIEWRIICRIDSDAIVIVEIFKKKTNRIPKHIIELCKKRLKDYDSEGEGN